MAVTLQNPRTSQPHEVGTPPALTPPRPPLAPARGILTGIVLAASFWLLVLVLVVVLLVALG